MQFVAAFNALGYEVPNPRKDWSAERADGICAPRWKSDRASGFFAAAAEKLQ